MKLTEQEQDRIHDALNTLEKTHATEAHILRTIVENECSTFRPDWAVSPGDRIQEWLDSNDTSWDQAMECTGLNQELFEHLLYGSLEVTPLLAKKLSKLFGTETYWLKFDSNYRQGKARINAGVESARQFLKALSEHLPPPEGKNHGLVLEGESLSTFVWLMGKTSSQMVRFDENDLHIPPGSLAKQVAEFLKPPAGKLELPPLRLGVAAILRRDGQILMHQRKGSHGAGTWSFPGGHIDEPETPLETIRREVWEETGLEVFGFRPLTFTSDVFEVEGKRYLTLYFQAVCPPELGEPRVMEPDKCVEWRWVTPGQWPGELFLPIQNLLKQGYRL